jgi:hypothetical protein
MSAVLASAVAAGFIWSIFLFFAAVFLREREQDAGFGWALAGAVVFVVTFSDRLPGKPDGLRGPLSLLPGVSSTREHFSSSQIALVILLVVYLFRIAVFYQLFLKDGRTIDEDGDEDLVNDVVAPALSYLCFAICTISLIAPAYGLGLIETLLLAGALVALHYWPLLRWLERYLRNLRAVLVVAWARVRRALRRIVLEAVLKIMWAEAPRYRDGHHDRSQWARKRLEVLKDEDKRARITEDELLKKAATHSVRKSRPTRKGQVSQ